MNSTTSRLLVLCAFLWITHIRRAIAWTLLADEESESQFERLHLSETSVAEMDIATQYWTSARRENAVGLFATGHVREGHNESTVPIEVLKRIHKRQTPVTNTAALYYVGRLFISYKTVDGTCTAAVIRSQTESVIATAAHCLYNRKSREHGRKIVFVPHYEYMNGNLAWAAAKVVYSRSFEDTTGTETVDDIAFLKLNKRKPEGTVESYVTSQLDAVPPAVVFGFWLNNLQLRAYGSRLVGTYYDLDKPLSTCEATVRTSHSGKLYLPDCDFAQGSSGGPVYHGSGEERYQVGVIIANWKWYSKARGAYVDSEIFCFGQLAKGLFNTADK